jgi:hypothetical protein
MNPSSDLCNRATKKMNMAVVMAWPFDEKKISGPGTMANIPREPDDGAASRSIDDETKGSRKEPAGCAAALNARETLAEQGQVMQSSIVGGIRRVLMM